MYLDKIISYVNKLLSNSSSFKLNYTDKLSLYLDNSIDHINRELLTNFRTISEYFEDSKFFFSVLKYISEKFDTKSFGGSISSCELGSLYYNEDDGKIYDSVFNEVFESPLIKDGYEVFYYIQKDNIFVSTKLQNGIAVWTKYTITDSHDIEIFESIEELGVQYFNYNELPDRYIRSCVIYYTAALYLEEEDELENQYSVYLSKANEELSIWKKQFYSVYDTSW